MKHMPPCGLCGEPGCLKCRLWHSSPAYRAYWESGRHLEKPAGRAADATPCVHVGGRLLALEVVARGLDVRRQWHRCLHPDRPLGEAVCFCLGCGPNCTGFKAEPENDPADLG